MQNSHILEYFRNIDITNMTRFTIQNIYNEILPEINTIATHFDLSHKIELLIQASEPKDNAQVLQKIDMNIIKSKIGSRIIEKILENVNLQGFLHICRYLNKNFDDLFFNENATFVYRKIFCFCKYSKRSESKLVKQKKNEEKKEASNIVYVKMKKNMDDGDKKIIKYTKRLYKNEKRIIKKIDYILVSDSLLMTLQELLVLRKKKQKIIQEIAGKICVEDLKTVKSYFYQNLIRLSDKKNIERIYKAVKDNVLDLSKDRFCNFVVQELCLYRRMKIIENNLEMFNTNSNIVLNVILYLIDNKMREAYKIINRFYLTSNDERKESLFQFCITNNTLNTKYVKMLEKLFFVKSKYNFNVISDFRKYYKKDWLATKSGRILVQAFLKSKSSYENKHDFVMHCKKDYKELLKDYYGIETMKCMIEYAGDEKIYIKKMIKKAEDATKKTRQRQN